MSTSLKTPPPSDQQIDLHLEIHIEHDSRANTALAILGTNDVARHRATLGYDAEVERWRITRTWDREVFELSWELGFNWLLRDVNLQLGQLARKQMEAANRPFVEAGKYAGGGV